MQCPSKTAGFRTSAGIRGAYSDAPLAILLAPGRRAPPSPPDCRYGAGCTNRDCLFLHPVSFCRRVAVYLHQGEVSAPAPKKVDRVSRWRGRACSMRLIPRHPGRRGTWTHVSSNSGKRRRVSRSQRLLAARAGLAAQVQVKGASKLAME